MLTYGASSRAFPCERQRRQYFAVNHDGMLSIQRRRNGEEVEAIHFPVSCIRRDSLQFAYSLYDVL